jgi:hypothetical protein
MSKDRLQVTGEADHEGFFKIRSYRNHHSLSFFTVGPSSGIDTTQFAFARLRYSQTKRSGSEIAKRASVEGSGTETTGGVGGTGGPSLHGGNTTVGGNEEGAPPEGCGPGTAITDDVGGSDMPFPPEKVGPWALNIGVPACGSSF